MPGLNQTGPMGQGAMMGRKMGRCTNFGAKLKSNPNTNNEINTQQPAEERNESKSSFGGQGMRRGMGRGNGFGANFGNNPTMNNEINTQQPAEEQNESRFCFGGQGMGRGRGMERGKGLGMRHQNGRRGFSQEHNL